MPVSTESHISKVVGRQLIGGENYYNVAWSNGEQSWVCVDQLEGQENNLNSIKQFELFEKLGINDQVEESSNEESISVSRPVDKEQPNKLVLQVLQTNTAKQCAELPKQSLGQPKTVVKSQNDKNALNLTKTADFITNQQKQTQIRQSQERNSQSSHKPIKNTKPIKKQKTQTKTDRLKTLTSTISDKPTCGSLRTRIPTYKIIGVRGSETEGVTHFKLKFEDKTSEWIQQNQIKAIGPQEVIKFYEKKLVWKTGLIDPS